MAKTTKKIEPKENPQVFICTHISGEAHIAINQRTWQPLMLQCKQRMYKKKIELG